jgi:acyl carrier protein
MTQPIEREIKEFVVKNFLFGQNGDSLTREQSFLENGIIDSTGVLELVAYLEQRFEIVIGDRELIPDNLDSIEKAARFVTRKLDAKGAQIAG